ncbi:hypothetical protein SAMN02745163_01252 [Clostridium cavendishii DSM 21758]|uniref:Uncharacterized protein n=1 Tax=Clostridium cavendishii DSM 21758 TaxID=1121302 RepID=A0A1M6GD50_9CLOT|nr:hypothetical protein [Clostridium cavendishii]SHJ07820.1 hypothetical protein SAMN02745163_01252 [Clostridium cavendishii DSM 21758]
MKIKKFLMLFSIIFLIIISTFENLNVLAISNVYKQGVYNISEFENYKATATLVTPNVRTSLMILDNEGDIKFFKEFDTVNEVINLGTIKKGNSLVIAGQGEIAIITTEIS